MAVLSYIPNSKLISLLTAADPQKILNVRVLSSTNLSLETDTFQPVVIIDLAEERVIAIDDKIAPPVETSKASRKRGEYQLAAFGETTTFYSLRDLLGAGLKTLEKHKSGTLDKLSKIKTTTKRIVAQDPAHLFDSAGLSEKYAAKLSDVWWYGINNSTQETQAWLKRACDCAGVDWASKDFSVSV